MDEILKRDQNFIVVLGAVTDDSNQYIKMLRVDPITGRLLISATGLAAGTVTSVSVVTANGFAGTVATATTTPAITLTTTITGILKGNGTAISAASAGTDYANLTFKTIQVATQSDVVATSASDTLILVAGSNITITTNAGTRTITIAASGGASGATTALDNLAAVAINTTLLPGADDGAALGSTTKNFSDLFLATGAVINYANSNVVITHTSGILTMGTGTLKITTPTNTATSVVTIDGTQSLTNKTYNGNTWTAGTGVLTIAAGKTLTANSSLTLAGTDGKTLTVSNSGTLAGGDAFVLAIAAGKTLTVSNSITLAGTDSTVMTFPTTSATIARTDAGNTFTGVSTASAWVLTSPTITTKLNPTTDDGAPLGDTTHNWSDLFLASGAVINYANSNVVITHTSGILTMGTGTLKITTPTNNATSVVTTDATQDLTNKTYNGNTFTAGTGVLTIAAAKTLTVSNSITLAGTDGKGINVGAATSLKILTGDGTNMVLSSYTLAAPGTSGNVATSDGTNWTSAAPAGAASFIMQELLIKSGTATPAGFSMTSSSDGLTLIVCWLDSSSSTTANITRWVRTTGTGYRRTHSTTLTVSGGELYGVAIVGSYIYVQCGIAATGAFRRYDLADLANVTTITISGSNTLRAGWNLWSDGTNLYSYQSASNFDKWTISGTTATNAATIGFTSAGSSVGGAWSDGTNVWMTDNSTGDGTMNIRKWAIAGGSVVATLTTTIASTRPTISSANPCTQLFAPATGLLAWCVMYNVCSEAAKTGIEVLATGIERP